MVTNKKDKDGTFGNHFLAKKIYENSYVGTNSKKCKLEERNYTQKNISFLYLNEFLIFKILLFSLKVTETISVVSKS